MIIKKKFELKNLILLFTSIFISLLFLEGFLRLFFMSDQVYLTKSSFDSPFISSTNKYWKVWHYANAKSNHTKNCFDVNYTSNSLGMRGDLPTNKESFKIALLGDSFVEGFGNSDKEVFSYILDSLSGHHVDILNFGTSGGFSTIHELSLYENFVRHFKPDLVLLFYLNYNDAYDNMKAINEGLVSPDLQLLYPTDSLNEVIKEIQSPVQPLKRKATVVNGLYSLSLAQKGIKNLEAFFQIALNMKFDFKRSLANVYNPDAKFELQQGYDIAQKSLERLKKLTDRDSSKLILFNLPDPYQIDKNWIKANQIKYDVTLDPYHPNRIIKNICKEQNINYHDMLPAAMKHIEENNLIFPFFSFTCDRHPSKYGHQYLANYLHKYLKDNKLYNQSK